MNSRRDFIINAATAAGALGMMQMLPLELIAKSRKRVSANDRINIGLIGVRNQGFNNVRAFLKLSEVNLLALCDVDESQLMRRKNDLNKSGFAIPFLYSDYRKMLENKEIDAVLIATPDHWHCLMLTDALAAGKHVYVEKPVANSIAEAKAMVAATEASGKVVQVNQWQRSQQHFKDATSYVRSGKLGKIVNTKTWMYRGTDPLPIIPDSAVPPGVDYNMWLGPAEKRPFNPNRFHYEFRWFWDYAGGLMCDWGVHLIDIMLWGMNAGEPISIFSTGGKRIFPDDARETPTYLNVTYDYGSFSNTWEHYMGVSGSQYGRGHGIAFIGTNGTLIVSRNNWEVIADGSKNAVKIDPVPLIEKSDTGLDLHAKNFIEVIKSGNLQDLACPIHAGALVAIHAHMGNISHRVGKSFCGILQKEFLIIVQPIL